MRPRFHFALVLLQHVNRRHHDVLQRGLMGKQIELLKYHRYVFAQCNPLLVGSDFVNAMTANSYRAAVDRRQTVQTAQQR